MAWSSLAVCSCLPLTSPSASSAAVPDPSSPFPPPSPSTSHRFAPLPPPSLSIATSSASSAAPQSFPTLHPSLQFANILWFKGSYNAQVFVGETEPPESVVKRFRKAVMQAGVISECRRRQFFETPQDIEKRKRQASQRKRSRRFAPRSDGMEKKVTSKAAVDDDDDNWGSIDDGTEAGV